jgi:hypothetical protein
MEEKYFTVATLTHDGDKRLEYLNDTVGTFLENTDFPGKIHWHFYHNGENNSPIVGKISELVSVFGERVYFSMRVGGKNMGVGYGINKINEWTQDYKYCLFLEGDWVTLSEDFTKQDKNWLIRSLELMDKENLDQIQLRRYLNDVDDRQFGFGYWTKESNVEKVEDSYVFLKEREYTNNPHIHRNETFFKAGIFPMQEFLDEDGRPTELKNGKNWGQAELIAEPLGKKLKSAWLKGGLMVHCDHFQYDSWDEVIKDLKGCDYDDGSLVHCKYGFLFPREEFCKHCHKEKDFTDLEEHNWRYERNLDNES